jgi:hypothetical protein
MFEADLIDNPVVGFAFTDDSPGLTLGGVDPSVDLGVFRRKKID